MTRTQTALTEGVAALMGGRRGMRVIGAGRLDEPESGHPAGTRYVLIGAKTLDDCEALEGLLWEISRLPDEAWDEGWTLDEHGDPQTRFQLKIFPTRAALRL
jgi:hypothetical protein